ncbi:hypothetical protein [Pleomorphomonas sp. PLEO]|uniref:hypothetical protein n=1 Tax=Pleomorphomonas sp. PLEO TaxID=3239306 RepID=UPI00351F4FF1
MSYVRNKFRQKAKSPKLIMAFIFVCSFLWADFSFADSWSCTPPPNDAIDVVIARYPRNYYIRPENEDIVRLVESSLERRLGFESELVSCRGSSCRISNEFIKFITRKNLDIPINNTQMSICTAHNSECVNRGCKKEYTENYDVIYAWKYGTLRLILEISKINNKSSIDKVVSDDQPFEPIFNGYHSRYIGVAKNARLFIEISNYASNYFE